MAAAMWAMIRITICMILLQTGEAQRENSAIVYWYQTIVSRGINRKDSYRSLCEKEDQTFQSEWQGHYKPSTHSLSNKKSH